MARRALGKAYVGAIRWGIALAVFNLALLLFLAFWPDATLRGWVSDIGGIVIPFVAAGCCFSAHLSTARQKLSAIQHLPAVLGGAALCYGAGMVLFTIETRAFGWSGNPGWGDLFFLFQYGFFIAATLLWPSKPLPSAIRWRTWSDAVILLIALLAFGWIGFVGPAVQGSVESTLGLFINASYPTFDLLIIFAVLQMMRRGFDPRFKVPTAVFLGALAVNTIGDFYFASAQFENVYKPGHWLDATWPLTASMAAMAGLMARIRMEVPGFVEAERNERIIIAQRTWVLYAPYILVPLVGALVVNVSVSHPDTLIRNGLYLIGLALIVAVMARQMLAISENNSLYAQLRDAVDQLETKNLQLEDAAAETKRVNNLLREMARKLAGENQNLARSNEVLEEMATTDGMTGLTNHRTFQIRLRQEVERAMAENKPLTLALVDVDYFKQYNDDFGHLAGDDVLKGISLLLCGAIREGDLAARYGGEEFALLLPGVSAAGALPIMDRLRQTVGEHPFAHRSVTLSIGVCSLGEDCRDAKSMLGKADRALYAAKSQGRNQVVAVYSTPYAA
jgi:diguanylate cyclase (GGDEF)-like protein